MKQLLMLLPWIWTRPYCNDGDERILKMDLIHLKSNSLHKNESKIIDYLENESGIHSITFDTITDPYTGHVIGSSTDRSDGVWAWHEFLPYLVKTYHIHLPRSFLKHMEKNDWDPRKSHERHTLDVNGDSISFLTPVRILNDMEIDKIYSSEELIRLREYNHELQENTLIEMTGAEYRKQLKIKRDAFIQSPDPEFLQGFYLCEVPKDYFE